MITIHGSVIEHSGIWFSSRPFGRMVQQQDVHDIDTRFSNRTFRYMVQ